MVLLEAALVIALVGALVYGTVRLWEMSREEARREAQGVSGTASRRLAAPGRWEVAHYDADGTTRVVLQKVSASGDVLDEHLVATIPAADEDYTDRFLAAMATARERLSLFESEGS